LCRLFFGTIKTVRKLTYIFGIFIMPQAISNTNVFLRLPAVINKIGLSRSCIYGKVDPNSKYYDPSFPVPVKIGARAIAFSSLQLQVWIDSKLNGGVV